MASTDVLQEGVVNLLGAIDATLIEVASFSAIEFSWMLTTLTSSSSQSSSDVAVCKTTSFACDDLYSS